MTKRPDEEQEPFIPEPLSLPMIKRAQEMLDGQSLPPGEPRYVFSDGQWFERNGRKLVPITGDRLKAFLGQ